MSVIEVSQTIAGLVSARVIAEGQGRSLGVAIIHMDTSARAELLIRGFDEFEINGSQHSSQPLGDGRLGEDS